MAEAVRRPPPKTALRPRWSVRNADVEPSTNVFVNYIPTDYTEQDLRKLFLPYGEILCSKIMVNLETGQSKCFGFVKMATLDQAKSAIQNLNGICLHGKKLLVKYAKSNERKETVSKTIYVKHIPACINLAQVCAWFNKFGQVDGVYPCNYEVTDQEFWRCFVSYTSCESAAQAIAQMNNQIPAAGMRPLHVKYADESRMSLPSKVPDPLPITTPQARGHVPSFEERFLLPSFLVF